MARGLDHILKRGTLILIIVLGLLVAEAAFFSVASAGFLNHTPDSIRFFRTHALVLMILPLAAGALALAAVASRRRHASGLATRLRQMAADGRLTRIAADHTDVEGLSDAVNEIVELADQSVRRAALQCKELEIQLKVANAERQHAEAIIYSISDAVLVTDPFDELVLANESAARTFDFDLRSATRAPISRVLRDQKMIDLIREMRQTNSNNERRIVEHCTHPPGSALTTARGEQGHAEIGHAESGGRTFKVTLSCVAGHSNQPAGVVAVLHDMTREKEIAEVKNSFVSNVSHELRTPLASIKAYIEMLIDGEADDDRTQREFYEVIQNEANRLSRLIDDILNISRIESGVMKIDKQPQSLTVIIKEALEVIEPQAQQKRLKIQEQLTPVFFQVMADKDMLYQAVLNLLSNAVKYTPEGGTISVRTLVDEAKKTVKTKISDTGVGIPPKDLPLVFDKFYRAEANNRMAKGTGLGLSLVKQIVENVHQGTILVDSEVGKGSSFGFELRML